MKRFIFVILVSSLTFSGCGMETSSTEEETRSEPTRISQQADEQIDPSEDSMLPAGNLVPKKLTGSAYAGSVACKECHEPEYYYWMRTPHSYMAKTAKTERLITTAAINSSDFPYPQEKVSLVLGNLKKQVYLTQVGEDFRFLDRQYDIAANKWEPFDIDEWEPISGLGSNKRASMTWNDNCAGCHTTGYDPSRGSFVELSVGCEECHGPGATHVETEHKDDIVNPRSLPPELSVSICAQCHARGVAMNNGFPFPTDFVPGDDIAEHLELVGPDYGKNNSFFWGNGMAAKHHQQYQEFIQSRHYMLGLTCLDCHIGHRLKLRNPPSMSRSVMMTVERRFVAARAYSVCVKCHIRAETELSPESATTLFQNQEVHSHHPSLIDTTAGLGDSSAGAGGRKMLCNDCHMPPTAPEKASFDMHTHTFRVPDAVATVDYGVPNGCSGCHDDKSTEWVTEQIRKLWLTESNVRAHFHRFAKEFKELNAKWNFAEKFLSGAPREKYRKMASFGQRMGSIETVADLATRITEASDSGASADRNGSYSLHQKVRTAEPELYRLSSEISALRKQISSDVRSIVDMSALEALNRVLQTAGEAPMSVPEMSETWTKTESLYRRFNSEVHKKGMELFEGKGRLTKWSDWIEINSDLKSGKVDEKHALHIQELSDLGLIRYRIELK